MTNQEKIVKAALDRLERLEAHQRLSQQETTELKRTLEGLYPAGSFKKSRRKAELTEEEKAKAIAAMHKRRGIPIQ